jgi:hypothetical protein
LVVLDGTRAYELLEKPTGFGLGSNSRIIPLNQVHDAEIIAVSKCDLLSPEQVDDVVRRIGVEAPGIEVIAYSARNMSNIERIVEVIASSRTSDKLPHPDDPSVFATEKASMGWYNLSCKIHSGRLDLSAFTNGLLRSISESFPGQMTGHVKVFISSPRVAVKIGLVEGQVQVEGLRGGRFLEGDGKMVINARITSSPSEIRIVIERSLDSICAQFEVTLIEKTASCFAPKPETPDHVFGD